MSDPNRDNALVRRPRANAQDRGSAQTRAVTHEVHFEGRLSGFWGALAAVLIVVALMALLLLGLATLTVVIWLAFALALLAIVMVSVRRIFGVFGGRDASTRGRAGRARRLPPP